MFLECYCVTREEPTRQKKTKLWATTVIRLVMCFWWLASMSWFFFGDWSQHKNIPKIFQVFKVCVWQYNNNNNNSGVIQVSNLHLFLLTWSNFNKTDHNQDYKCNQFSKSKGVLDACCPFHTPTIYKHGQCWKKKEQVHEIGSSFLFALTYISGHPLLSTK